MNFHRVYSGELLSCQPKELVKDSILGIRLLAPMCSSRASTSASRSSAVSFLPEKANDICVRVNPLVSGITHQDQTEVIRQRKEKVNNVGEMPRSKHRLGITWVGRLSFSLRLINNLGYYRELEGDKAGGHGVEG